MKKVKAAAKPAPKAVTPSPAKKTTEAVAATTKSGKMAVVKDAENLIIRYKTPEPLPEGQQYSPTDPALRELTPDAFLHLKEGEVVVATGRTESGNIIQGCIVKKAEPEKRAVHVTVYTSTEHKGVLLTFNVNHDEIRYDKLRLKVFDASPHDRDTVLKWKAAGEQEVLSKATSNTKNFEAEEEIVEVPKADATFIEKEGLAVGSIVAITYWGDKSIFLGRVFQIDAKNIRATFFDADEIEKGHLRLIKDEWCDMLADEAPCAVRRANDREIAAYEKTETRLGITPASPKTSPATPAKKASDKPPVTQYVKNGKKVAAQPEPKSKPAEVKAPAKKAAPAPVKKAAVKKAPAKKVVAKKKGGKK